MKTMQEQPQTPPSTLNNNMHNNTHFTTCSSTPYDDDDDDASAPSSPGGHLYYYSAPTSPMHYLSSSSTIPSLALSCSSSPFENFDDFNDNFDFPAMLSGNETCSRPMSSADELFCDGKIRPMKLSSHLRLPQMLPPLLDEDEENNEVLEDDGEKNGISRIKFRNNSLHRRTRSTPLRSNEFGDDDVIVANIHQEIGNVYEEGGEIEEDANSRTTTRKITKKSFGRSSKRWILLKEFLYRSKSEGNNNKNNGHKFWNNLSCSHVHKEKKVEKMEKSNKEKTKIPKMKKKGENMGKRRMETMQSSHEMHYISKRAQDEEMKRKTFLPYRQGLLGCLGFSSRSYGTWNVFTRSLNHVSSM